RPRVAGPSGHAARLLPRAGAEAGADTREVAGEVARHLAFHHQAPGRVALELATQGSDELAVQVASIEVATLEPRLRAGRRGATQPDGDPAGVGAVIQSEAVAIGEPDFRVGAETHQG